MHRARLLLAVLTMAFGLFVPSTSQAQIDPIFQETLDPRTPLELTSGSNAEEGTILLGALFENATRLSAFVGPDHGMGPWTEETVDPPGPGNETFFALSRRTVCVDGVCYFTAVNGATNDLELFLRTPGGTWSRSTIVAGDGYFNSDLGLNDGALTVLGYDALTRTLEVFSAPLPATPGTVPTFTQRASRGGAADAIFGALRATLAADDTSDDFLVLFETDEGLTELAQPLGPWHTSERGDPAPPSWDVEGDPGRVLSWGELDDAAFETALGVLFSPPSGTPATLREASSLLDCGVYLCVRHNQDGVVELAVLGPDGEVFQDFTMIGLATLLQDGEAPSGFDITKVDDRFPGLPGFWISWPQGSAFVGVTVDTGTVTTIELDRAGPDAPETGPITGEATAEFPNVAEGFAGSLVAQVVDTQRPGAPPVAEIPTLDTLGLGALTLVLILLGSTRLRRRAGAT